MVVSCSVCGEQYGVTEDVTFHKFPANEERRKKWLVAVQRSNWLPGKRSMLCSNHFSRDKFVYKVSGDKVRRYLMPDTVPTIFDTTKSRKLSNESQQLVVNKDTSILNENGSTNVTAAQLNLVQRGVDTTATDAAVNSNQSLNLEILAATSVALEPYSITTEQELIQEGKYTTEADSTQVEPPAATSITVQSSNSNNSEEKAQSHQKRVVNFSRITKRVCNGIKTQTDLKLLPKRSRQVYPGDFKQLNYNDITEVSKSWNVLNNYIKKMRSNMKVLRQRNRRLEKRVTDLKSVVKFLKNRIVAKDSAAVRLCGNSEFLAPTESIPKEDLIYRVSNPLIDHDYISVKNKKSTP